MKWLVRAGVVLAASYVVLCGAVAATMLQTPERFGHVMRDVPMPLVWGALPGTRIWLLARAGRLHEGDLAPDFMLPVQDRTSRVMLSSFRGKRPVVLVFGSYT
jgi:uncharacterized membrane protein